jgi:DNA adenine methylase
MSEKDAADSTDETYQGWSRSTLMAFPYFGGKVQYASQIIERIPAHDRYLEPFSGAASVLLNKPESHVEVLNDRNENVVTFFRVLRTRRDELVEFLEATPYSRAVCERWESQLYGDADLPDVDDVTLAGRWFALRHMRFAGRMNRYGGFSAPGEKNEARDYRKNIAALDEVRERLENVVLECGDYADVLDRYAELSDFAYVDPPYVGNETSYGFDGFDHERLIATLDEWPGRWMLSYRDLPDALAPEDYHVEEFGATNRAQTTGERSVVERLVMNFDPAQESSFVDRSTEQRKLQEVGHVAE